MCKKMEAEVTEAAYLDQTRDRALFLIHRETRGSADTEAAMRRVARKCGVSYWMLWTLRHRPPKLLDKFVRAYFAIDAAFQAEKDRQARKTQYDLTRSKATAGHDHPFVRTVSSLVGEDDA